MRANLEGIEGAEPKHDEEWKRGQEKKSKATVLTFT